METATLYNRLVRAYSEENLHRITITLIGLYKAEQFGTLEQIAGLVGETVEMVIDPDLKYFSKLMMLYHPDRGHYHRKEIERLAAKDDRDGLLSYSHVLLLERIEEIAVNLSCLEDIDYSPVYEWDWDTDGFHIVGDITANHIREKGGRSFQRKRGISFYEAFQLRMLGNTSSQLPAYYFGEIEELELSQSGIDDLNGIQYCIQARSIDLSSNVISDISDMWELSELEDLDLSDNKLELIDCLSNLQNLRIVKLSGNRISDISALLHLNKLEYLEIGGNRVSRSQICALEEKGVAVVSD